MKKTLLLILMTFILLDSVYSIEINPENLNMCIELEDNLKFDIQVHPLENVIYYSVLNPYNTSITNISYNLYIINNETNKIEDMINVNIPDLPPDYFSCDFSQQIYFPYKKMLDIGIFDIDYSVNGERKNSYYNMIAKQYFILDGCVEINSWDRLMTIETLT